LADYCGVGEPSAISVVKACFEAFSCFFVCFGTFFSFLGDLVGSKGLTSSTI